MATFFNGRLLTTPSIESAVDDSQMFNMNSPKYPNILAILGSSLGGVPMKPTYHASPMDAAKALVGGDLLTAVRKAFNPSAETGSPFKICTVRLNDADPSSLDIAGEGALSNATVMTLTSVDYGAHVNSINCTITKADADTTRRVEVRYGDRAWIKSGIGKAPLTVTYTGSNGTATVGITTTAITLTDSAAHALTLADYRNIQELCDAINAISGGHWTAVALLPTWPAVKGLDEIATPESAKSTTVTLRADLRAIVDWINAYCYDVVTAEIGDRYVPPGDIVTQYLSGGSNGAALVNDDWQDGFDALQGEDVSWVVPLSDDPDIWAMCSAHCDFMSTNGHSERRGFVGGAAEDTIDVAMAAAQDIASDRMALVWPTMLEKDDAGVLMPTPAYFAAAQVAGGFAAQNPGNTMTNKTVKTYGLYPDNASIPDSDDLINAGVLGLRRAKKGVVVSKAVSTWTQDDRFNRVEISCGAAVDYVTRSVRGALDRFVGAKGAPITLHQAVATVDSELRSLSIPEPVGVGVLVGDDVNPPYSDIVVDITGDVMRVSFVCSPVIPINYVLVTLYAKPWSGRESIANPYTSNP